MLYPSLDLVGLIVYIAKEEGTTTVPSINRWVAWPARRFFLWARFLLIATDRSRTLCLKGRIYSNGSIFSVLNINISSFVFFVLFFLFFFWSSASLLSKCCDLVFFYLKFVQHGSYGFLDWDQQKKESFCKKKKIFRTKHDFILFFLYILLFQMWWHF